MVNNSFLSIVSVTSAIKIVWYDYLYMSYIQLYWFIRFTFAVEMVFKIYTLSVYFIA